MSAPGYSDYADFGARRTGIGRLRGRFGQFALIAVAHALVLFGFYSGSLHRVVQHAAPKEVFVSFVAPPPPKAAPPLPLALTPVHMLPPPAISVPPTVVAIAPSERAISVPPPPAATAAEKATPVRLAAAAPAAPPAPARAAAPRTITSGVEYVQAPQPAYPAMSKRMGEQGKVVLRVLVNEKGLPDQVLVQSSSGFARLDEAGRQAALHALFKPYMEDGRPVAVFVIVPLNFTLAS
jgi:protein TonB